MSTSQSDFTGGVVLSYTSILLQQLVMAENSRPVYNSSSRAQQANLQMLRMTLQSHLQRTMRLLESLQVSMHSLMSIMLQIGGTHAQHPGWADCNAALRNGSRRRRGGGHWLRHKQGEPPGSSCSRLPRTRCWSGDIFSDLPLCNSQSVSTILPPTVRMGAERSATIDVPNMCTVSKRCFAALTMVFKFSNSNAAGGCCWDGINRGWGAAKG